MDDEFYRLLSFFRLSPYPRTIIQHFHEHGGANTPTEIAEATDINLTHVSHHLIKLKDEGLVTVINPDAPRHRYYRLAQKGERFVEQLVAHGYLTK